MRKSDKKIDTAIRQALTLVCEQLLKQVTGFKWLTHRVNYQDFPASLRVICVFESQQQLNQACQLKMDEDVCQLIQHKLLKASIKLKDIRNHVSLVSEEHFSALSHGKGRERRH